MTIREPDRRKVHNRLVDVIGQPEADLIMEMFPTPDTASQIANLRAEMHIELAGLRAEFKDDIATLRAEVKDDIATLRAHTQMGFANVDTRFAQVDAKMAELRVEIHQGFRSQTIWMVATMLTLAGVIVASFAAFH